MVKFKAKKDSGKNVIFSLLTVLTLLWMLRMVSIDFRPLGLLVYPKAIAHKTSRNDSRVLIKPLD